MDHIVENLHYVKMLSCNPPPFMYRTKIIQQQAAINIITSKVDYKITRFLDWLIAATIHCIAISQ